jgi:Recombination endonuclease VII
VVADLLGGREWSDSRDRQAVIGHDHATGKIRRVICGACNVGIGHFDDDRPDRSAPRRTCGLRRVR